MKKFHIEMLLTIDEQIADSLKGLKSFPNEVIEDFCRISIGGILKPINPKQISSAAAKLKVDEGVVTQGLEAFSKLFLQATKMQLSQEDVSLSMKLLGFSEEAVSRIAGQYEGGKGEVRGLLMMRGPPYRRFRNLEWRFDVKLASRSAYDQCNPTFFIKIHTSTRKPLVENNFDNKHSKKTQNIDGKSSEKTLKSFEYQQRLTCQDGGSFLNETFLLEFPPATLSHILRSLKEAVKESKKSRIRRVIEHL